MISYISCIDSNLFFLNRSPLLFSKLSRDLSNAGSLNNVICIFASNKLSDFCSESKQEGIVQEVASLCE